MPSSVIEDENTFLISTYFPALEPQDYAVISPVLDGLESGQFLDHVLNDYANWVQDQITICQDPKARFSKIEAALLKLINFKNLNTQIKPTLFPDWQPQSIRTPKQPTPKFMAVPVAELNRFPTLCAFLEYPLTEASTYLDLLKGTTDLNLPAFAQTIWFLSPDQEVAIYNPDQSGSFYEPMTETLLFLTPVLANGHLEEDPLLSAVKLLKECLVHFALKNPETHTQVDLLNRDIQLFSYLYTVNIHAFLEREWLKGETVDRPETKKSKATWHKKILQNLTQNEKLDLVLEQQQYVENVKTQYVHFYRDHLIKANQAMGFDMIDLEFRILTFLPAPDVEKLNQDS